MFYAMLPHMNEVLILNKQIGETPLACIERFRAAHSEYVGVKMTYAGRLDPIASGLLIVLTGEKVHEKESYLDLPKVYECTALVGVATDTYDVLGMPVADFFHESESNELPDKSDEDTVRRTLEAFVGSFQQAYPPYSSKTVDGKQLHQIARDGEIDRVKIPERAVTVEWVRDVDVREISLREISRQITDTLSRVTGDFRQEAIAHAWMDLFKSHENVATIDTLRVVSFTIAVSSGTYIRGIVNSLGEKLGIGACILSLYRTHVGNFSLPAEEILTD